MSAPKPFPRTRPLIRWVGDRHLLISWSGDDQREDGGDAVRSVMDQLSRQRPAALIDAVPADATLLLSFDASTLDPERAAHEVERLLASSDVHAAPVARRLMEIPVCYDGVHAPDLADLARRRHLTEFDIIALHSRAEYTVRFLGFIPGFAYLSGLPKEIEAPRLDTPRTKVPAGSVGIAGDRTGVYPLEVPGGWRLIGRTPLKMFDPARDPPTLLHAGDRVRFIPIDERRFEELVRANDK